MNSNNGGGPSEAIEWQRDQTIYQPHKATMGELLKNLSLEYWYKMLIVASFALIVMSLTVHLEVLPNIALLAMSFGGFLIGLGEWVNHPYREAVNFQLGAKISGHLRRNCIGGVLTTLIGAILVIAGLWKAIATIV